MVLIGVLLVLSVMVFAGYLSALAFLAQGIHPKWATLAAGIGSVSFILGSLLAIASKIPVREEPTQWIGDILTIGVMAITWVWIVYAWGHHSQTHPVEI